MQGSRHLSVQRILRTVCEIRRRGSLYYLSIRFVESDEQSRVFGSIHSFAIYTEIDGYRQTTANSLTRSEVLAFKRL